MDAWCGHSRNYSIDDSKDIFDDRFIVLVGAFSRREFIIKYINNLYYKSYENDTCSCFMV